MHAEGFRILVTIFKFTKCKDQSVRLLNHHDHPSTLLLLRQGLYPRIHHVLPQLSSTTGHRRSLGKLPQTTRRRRSRWVNSFSLSRVLLQQLDLDLKLIKAQRRNGQARMPPILLPAHAHDARGPDREIIEVGGLYFGVGADTDGC